MIESDNAFLRIGGYITGWDCAAYHFDRVKHAQSWNCGTVLDLGLGLVECMPVVSTVVALFDRCIINCCHTQSEDTSLGITVIENTPNQNDTTLKTSKIGLKVDKYDLQDTDTEEARKERVEKYKKPSPEPGNQLKKVFDQNLEIVKRGYYLKDGNKVIVDNTDIYLGLELISAEEPPAIEDRGFEPSQIEVLQGDCVTICKQLQEQGLTPLLLDAANEHSPGGDPEYARAQEERICRSSNLYQSIKKFKDESGKNQFIPTDKSLYVKNVHIFRGQQDEAYPLFDQDEQFTISVAACAAPELRSKKKEFPVKLDEKSGKYLPDNWSQQTHDSYKNLVLTKLRAIYSTALTKDHDSLVLVPFGCGAFHNPQDLMIECMAQVHQEFQGCFKKVVLSVINDHNGKQNVEIFKELEKQTAVEKKKSRLDEIVDSFGVD